MGNDFEIDIQNVQEDAFGDIALPGNFITEGIVENDDIRVYIKQDVYDKLERYALEDTGHERGTFLFGNYTVEHNKKHVIISDYIEAKYTDASASTLTFTHKTWDYVHREHESKFPENKMVGWQHTHPNYGIFLSNYDLFIHENFFNLDFQIAYVIDPIQNIRGFFQWKNGKIEKLKGFYIYDDIGKKIKQPSTSTKSGKIDVPSGNGKWINIVISLLVAAVVVLGSAFISLNKKYSEQLSVQNSVVQKMADYQNTIDVLSEKMGSSNSTGTQQNGADAGAEAYSEILLVKYTVEQGDSLFSICEKKGIDYGSNLKFILLINGIDDPDSILCGEEILLPVIKQ